MLRKSTNASLVQAPWLVADVDLIIPVYKNKALVEQCITSVLENVEEISAHSPRLIIINDSPDDTEVTTYLREEASRGHIGLLIENPKNVGFVKSVNKALKESRDREATAILINSDTITFPGTLKELIAVADLDAQTAFVCPRSNNASICSFPAPRHARSGATLSPSECHRAWLDLSDLLPRVSYVPTTVGFYMLIKSVVLRNFGGLDENFGVGYEEENDLVMRAGKVGFRAVIANHSFAFHAGSASFGLLDFALEDHRQANFAIIQKLHPEFRPLIEAYDASPETRAERMLKGLLPDRNGRLRIAFNLLAMGAHFNGTNEFIVNVLKSFVKIARDRYEITLLCHEHAAKFHGLDELGVRLRTDLDDKYAVAVKFGQPYDLHVVNVMEDTAPINVYCMLDVISLDCGPLRHSQQVADLWAYVAETANGCAFISDFSHRTFLGRFPDAGIKSYAALLPTQVDCYADRYDDVTDGDYHVFVAGNHFDHKDSSRTGKKLATSFPTLGFVVLGAPGVYPPNVRLLKSGSVSDHEMKAVMGNSSVVVLPSYYEGFGFTFMHALALKKPIVARDIPATREIMATFGDVAGVYLFGDDDELVEALAAAVDGPQSSVSVSHGLDWLAWTSGFVDFLDQLISDRAEIYPKLRSRVRFGDVLRQKQHAREQAAALKASKEVRLRWKDLSRLSDEKLVETAYREFLGREPDPQGLDHHLAMLRQGGSRAEVIDAFSTSPEYLDSGRRVTVEGLPVEEPKTSRRRRLFRRK